MDYPNLRHRQIQRLKFVSSYIHAQKKIKFKLKSRRNLKRKQTLTAAKCFRHSPVASSSTIPIIDVHLGSRFRCLRPFILSMLSKNIYFSPPLRHSMEIMEHKTRGEKGERYSAIKKSFWRNYIGTSIYGWSHSTVIITSSGQYQNFPMNTRP